MTARTKKGPAVKYRWRQFLGVLYRGTLLRTCSQQPKAVQPYPTRLEMCLRAPGTSVAFGTRTPDGEETRVNMTVITKLKVPLQNVEGPFTVNTRSPAVLIPRGSMLEIRNLIYKRGPYTCAERVRGVVFYQADSYE